MKLSKLVLIAAGAALLLLTGAAQAKDRTQTDMGAGGRASGGLPAGRVMDAQRSGTANSRMGVGTAKPTSSPRQRQEAAKHNPYDSNQRRHNEGRSVSK